MRSRRRRLTLSTQNPPCQFAHEASTVFAMDKFANAEAMSPKDRADHVEANTVATGTSFLRVLKKQLKQ